MMSDSRWIAANVRGLGDARKKMFLMKQLKQRKIDVAILSETKVWDENSQDIKQDDSYDCICTANPRNRNASRGVMIVWRKINKINVKMLSRDREANMLIARVEISGKIILVCGVYGPSRDEPGFFKDLEEQIVANSPDNVIIAGDFNVTLDHTRDNENYIGERNRIARIELNKVIERQQLADAYRRIHGDKREFTWLCERGAQRSRLDFVLVSSNLVSAITRIEITPEMCGSDHRALEMTLDFDRFVQGKGVWKHTKTTC